MNWDYSGTTNIPPPQQSYPPPPPNYHLPPENYQHQQQQQSPPSQQQQPPPAQPFQGHQHHVTQHQIPPPTYSYPPPSNPMLQHHHHQQHQHHSVEIQQSPQPQPGYMLPHANSPQLKLPTNSPLNPGQQHVPVPVPHTPQGTPNFGNFIPAGQGPPPGQLRVGSPGSHLNTNTNGPEHDLPSELLNLGWRKFWSKRENRWYFWNCNNNESLWEMPQISHSLYNPDPLGINGPQSQSQSSGFQLGVKRRASSGEHMGSPTVKKFILAGPWDLEVVSNVYTSSAPVPEVSLLPVHPEIEFLRWQLMGKLRNCYQTSCNNREGIDAPKESLTRWILEQKVTELKGIDPIFPSCANPDGVVSQVMLKEIMNDVPLKIVKPRFTGDARKQLTKYADACKRIIETRSVSNEARKTVKWKVDETLTWLKTIVGSSYEALQERMSHIRSTCQIHVHAAALSSVEGICRKMSTFSNQYGQQVREAHLKLLVEPEKVISMENKQEEKGRFRCHPALTGPYFFNESNKLPQIEFHQKDRDIALLKYKNDTVSITSQYLQKLEQLYRYNCIDDKKFEFFLARCYCLIKRYNAYTEDFTSSQSTQGSLPIPVFESIQRNFGISFECFSSPFNCYFRQYCSAFPDSDAYFGSRGTFLEYWPISGSFGVNPPFSEDLIDKCITHVEELLAGTKEAMSFIIFVPEYTEESRGDSVPISSDLECQWLKRLENSRWKKKQVTIPAFEHEYRSSAQHQILKKSEVSVRATHATVVFWLQNDAGNEEWKPTEQKVDALIDAYRPGRERERDRQDLLAPERQNPHQADKALAAALVSSQPLPVPGPGVTSVHIPQVSTSQTTTSSSLTSTVAT